MQRIYIFIDDSGVFHSNHNHFVYAGYCFVDSKTKESAKRKYKNLVKKISRETNCNSELKASGLRHKHKRALFNILRNEYSFSVTVKIEKIEKHILSHKKSIQRFKDYAVKRVIKRLFQKLIKEQVISPEEDIELLLNIDQQPFATNGRYDLSEGIFEELRQGINNFNYGCFYEPILSGDFKIILKSCDSSKDYLIQASDILANRIYNAHTHSRFDLLAINNHVELNLP